MRGNLPGPEGLAGHFARAQPLYLAVRADLCAGASAALHGWSVVPLRPAPCAWHPLPCTDPMAWAKAQLHRTDIRPCQRGSRGILRQAPETGPELGGTFFGHPRGLATLFLTEMWERFTYYACGPCSCCSGPRSILRRIRPRRQDCGGHLRVVHRLGISRGLPGGWIADRLIGAQRAVLAGGVAISLGNALLALSTTPRGFYLGWS